MNIVQETVGGVLVLRLSGQLMGGAEAEAVREAVQESLKQGVTRILVDIEGVTWVNSTGLGVLIASHMAARQAGGALKLIRPSRRIESILNVTRLSTVFDIHKTEEDARRSFAAAPAG